ncbi:hypothetical protein IJ579_05505, partial [bacterium]|nr:hypothetical protein [bacterium]
MKRLELVFTKPSRIMNEVNQNFSHSELYKANRHSGARTCEPVCRAVSESNQIDRCRNEFGMTEKTSLPNHGGRKVKSPRPQRFLVGEGRISMRKLSIRNSGEGTTHTNTPQLKGLPPFETLPSKQSGELFARGKVGMGGSICHIKQPTPTLPNHGGRKAAFTLAEVLITLAI